MSIEGQLREFHQAMKIDLDRYDILEKLAKRDLVGLSSDQLKLLNLRQEMIEEEYEEMVNQAEVLPDLCKEMIDVVYTIVGLFVTLGLPFDDMFREVHRSNMSKLDDQGNPVYNESGKVMKGPNFKPADMETYINERI